MGFLGLGLGMIISSLVTKYRDFSYLIGLGQLLMLMFSAVLHPMALVAAKCQSMFGWLSTIHSLYYREYRYMLERGSFCFDYCITFMLTGIVF
jgi:lipopolysaccharide transport system permease protein